MNVKLRKEAIGQNTSFVELVLNKISESRARTGQNKTIFAACPNSISVIRSSLKSAKRCNAPIKFAATLNQVDRDRGYTGLNHHEFVQTIKQEAKAINFTGPVMIAIDHGGPWLKDIQSLEKWSYKKAMEEVKRSFESAIDAGFDLIHVDPTVDITLPKGAIIEIDVVAERTLELIEHTEKYRKSRNLPKIAYEVGTEEVHGGLADLTVFHKFLTLLKEGIRDRGLEEIWPCFVVGKVGTDLHTTHFDREMAVKLTSIVKEYGSLIKGHYSDSVENPEEYPLSGMGAANVGPEFTEREYDGLMELNDIEKNLHFTGMVAKPAGIKEILWDAVIGSNRWKKWLQEDEKERSFYDLDEDRQLWLIKTGCRYIWSKDEVVAARSRLEKNLSLNGINTEEILLSHIDQAMDKYFYKFNLVNFNDYLNSHNN